MLLLFSTVAAAAPAPSPGPGPPQGSATTSPPTPHQSIVIEGDAGFEQPTIVSGVRGGSGTAEDPYIISNWTIAQVHTGGIVLRDTTAHVVIRDVVLPSVAQDVPSLLACQTDPDARSCAADGILLDGAENVTVRRVQVLDQFEAVDVRDARNVAVDGLEARFDAPGPAPSPVDGALRGVAVSDSRNVTVREAAIWNATEPVVVEGSRQVRLARSTLDAHRRGSPVEVGPKTENLTVAHVRFHGSPLLMEGPDLRNVTIAESTFEAMGRLDRGAVGVETGDRGEVQLRGATLCGNTIGGVDGLGVSLGQSADVAVEGNRFQDLGQAAHLQGPRGLVVEGNLFGEDAGGLTTAVPDVKAHGNSFVGGTVTMRAYQPPGGADRDPDARGNWWGHEDGPRVVYKDRLGNWVFTRNSPGTLLEAEDGLEPPFDPWLESPPDLDHDCVPGDGAGAADPRPGPTLAETPSPPGS